ncbi:MAG: OmpH family outer membrane protein [Deltaproteobacteria bacterium]|nr:OmpH family outer membrane protein [Deltaproteobacteria bacterium]
MRKYLAIAIVSASLCLASSAGRAADARIAVIDIQKIETESKAGMEAKASFSKEVEARTKVITAREESLRQLDEEYKKDRDSLTAAQRSEREDRLAREAREIKRLRDDASGELQKKGMELRGKNLKDIIAVVKKAAEEGRYTLVLDRRQIVYAPDSIDITRNVIDMYNAAQTESAK